MRVNRKVLGLLLAFSLLMSGIVSAHEIIQGNNCFIEADRVVSGNVFATCRDLVIDGRIDGSLFGVASKAIINGEITGDIYLLAAQLDISGSVGDDLHFAGGVLNIEPEMAFDRGDVINLSLSARIADNVEIPGNMVSLGYQLILDGNVDRDLSFWGSALAISGTIGGNVDAQVGDSESDPGWLLDTAMTLAGVEVTNPGLRVVPTGEIDGYLRYTGPTPGIINGKLAEEPNYTPVTNDTVAIPLGETQSYLGPYISRVAHEFALLGIIGAIGLIIAPRLIQSPIQNLRRQPFNSLGVGIPAFFLPLVVFFMVVIITLVVMIVLSVVRLTDLALVGGLISGLVSISGMGIFYFVAIFIARIVVSMAIGQIVVRLTIGDDGSQRIIFLSLFVGVFLLALITSLPTIGWMVNALTLAVGLGAILTRTQSKIRDLREAGLAAALYTRGGKVPRMLPAHAGEARYIPPPTIDDDTPQPGMDNLPEGFEWWDN